MIELFLGEVQRIGQPDYIPNKTDVLMARTKTTCISKTKFESGQLSIHMFDVGGQRSERKKWNQMVKSLVLFQSIDFLKAKLPKVPLKHYFPEYTAGNDVNKAPNYI
ncbi:uncharacterized protein MELLADRAFT_94599 [Melampsora larici-populina 98AG31]|uniref:Uncharacterized protein n=1 Tax=Melampsora larici-populina (strain 98AG31 / pathotype 3-4-7) TaxID=747676 RepID=F4RC16_MELLP|nr:uncharacterized protein MELLADRAFT_94599 [Melampsora larici-populina 98AG31]EGG10242.1 hypothetical protein MELLADRAFT_94599 [Melampsora larici-populina 98AG31]